MSVIDEILAANEIYSRTHELRKLTPRPERKLAVLTCMDTRLSIRTLGLKTGDAHIIRNAGGIVTEDTLRSLVVSHYLLGTEEIMVINHTNCRSSAPIPGFPRPSPCAASSTTSLAAISAKSRTPDRCPYNPPPIPSPRRPTNVEGSEAEGPFLRSLPYPITSLLRCFVTSPLPTTRSLHV